VGNVIETTAIAAVDPEGNVLAKGDLYGQTKIAIERIKFALEHVGASLDDVIKTRIFLTDLERWTEAARAHKEFFDEIQPSTGFIGVVGFPHPDVMVEFEVTAVVDED
jgi:enamine deaminase RidA (YjgF/YER057c/UK114 family)